MVQSSPHNSREAVKINTEFTGINSVLAMYAEAANDQLFMGEVQKIGDMPRAVQRTLNEVLINNTVVGLGKNKAINDSSKEDALKYG